MNVLPPSMVLPGTGAGGSGRARGWRSLRLALALGWLAAGLGVASAAGAAETAGVQEIELLPTPRREGGRPLLDVLRERRSVREFAVRELSRSVLSDLLWAGFGVNRAETGQRTAPSTMNLRVVDLYLVTAQGAWRYEAERHGLTRVAARDVRPLTGGQDYVKTAPVALVYVADHRRLAKVAEAERDFYAAADTGFVAQNIYLFCASEGLGSVVHMPGDRTALAAALQLAPEQHIVLAHSVGYPALAGGAVNRPN